IWLSWGTRPSFSCQMESLPASAKDVQLFCYCGKFIRPRNCWKRQAERSRSDSGATLDQTSEASRCSYAFFQPCECLIHISRCRVEHRHVTQRNISLG